MKNDKKTAYVMNDNASTMQSFLCMSNIGKYKIMNVVTFDMKT